MTIKQVRDLQEELESVIQEKIEEFEEQTDTIISMISIERIDARTHELERNRFQINQVKTCVHL